MTHSDGVIVPASRGLPVVHHVILLLEATAASLMHPLPSLCVTLPSCLRSYTPGDPEAQVKEATEQVYAIMCECRTQPPSAVLQVLSVLLEF